MSHIAISSRKLLVTPFARNFQLMRILSQAFSNIVVEELNGTTLIGINRPEKQNCVNPATAKELIEAFDSFEANDASPVAVLYGKGGTFCAGFDLASLKEAAVADVEALHFNPDSPQGIGPLGPTRKFLKKPVIAAINGYAVAGGLELALMCDLRVVEDTAVLGVFCRRFGVPLLDGGSVRLPHLIGLSRALDLILTGRAVSGKEAFEIGLCNRITACGTAVGIATQLAQSIARFPQGCLNRDRLSAYNSMYNSKSFKDALSYEMKNGLEVLKTESIPGAISFTEGVGKHGSFNLNVTQKK